MPRGWDKRPPDLPAWVTLLLIGLLLTAAVLYLYFGYGSAQAAARDRWNCAVSEWCPPRDARLPLWTDDWGEHWYWPEADDE